MHAHAGRASRRTPCGGGRTEFSILVIGIPPSRRHHDLAGLHAGPDDPRVLPVERRLRNSRITRLSRLILARAAGFPLGRPSFHENPLLLTKTATNTRSASADDMPSASAVRQDASPSDASSSNVLTALLMIFLTREACGAASPRKSCIFRGTARRHSGRHSAPARTGAQKASARSARALPNGPDALDARRFVRIASAFRGGRPSGAVLFEFNLLPD